MKGKVFPIITYDIQVFNPKNREWKLLGYENEDLPLVELKQEVQNISMFENAPIRIIKLTRNVKDDDENIEISEPIIKQVGKIVNSNQFVLRDRIC